jgi:hypothetical protein
MDDVGSVLPNLKPGGQRFDFEDLGTAAYA